jgi:predicted AAA+ superfamily ATPase
MIKRSYYTEKVEKAVSRSRVTAILGPRQCGKTTLARIIKKKYTAVFLDLESPKDNAFLKNPELSLGQIKGLVIIDEIQLRRDLFPILRVLCDKKNIRFLISGSASSGLVKEASESLAGRIEFIDLQGFDESETGYTSRNKLWLRGGFPLSFLSKTNEDSAVWREGFIRTFLERDLPSFGIRIPAPAMRRFWAMLAHYHGQVWNASEFSRSIGTSDKTAKEYLDILTHTYMVHQLMPWYENSKKRQVKAPKIYFRDSGLLHSLYNIQTTRELLSHPKCGASWEGYIIEQILRHKGNSQIYFWAAHGGGEVDLLLFSGGKRYGVEVKFTENPAATKSMHTAMSYLGLSHMYIICPGERTFQLSKDITVCPLDHIKSIL